MKRMMLVWVMMLCLLPLGARAEEETAPALYPIRENGLWGFMNMAGEVVIEPQWKQVQRFAGDYALVTTLESQYGLIDRCGQYVVEPQEHLRILQFDEVWELEIWGTENDGVGFFDKASGFCMPPDSEYMSLLNWYEDGSGPIPVMNRDEKIGYLDRQNGEVVIPFIYDEVSESIGFYNGYSIATTVSRDGPNERLQFHLIDRSGTEVCFPDGIYACGDVSEDRLVVCGSNGYGLAKPDGSIVVEPIYSAMSWPEEGVIGFQELKDGAYFSGHMDLDGNIIVPAIYRLSDDVRHEPSDDVYWFDHGYAFFDDYAAEGEWPDNCRSVILDKAGNEVLSMPYRMNDGRLITLKLWIGNDVTEAGLIWYKVCDHDSDYNKVYDEGVHYGLIWIHDGTWEFLTDPVFEKIKDHFPDGFYSVYGNYFTEGLQEVCVDGFWGYIDETAQWVIPPQYDKAASFSDGLALVEKDGKLMYIDHSGAVVWEER